jgi:hypothetical protein
MWRFSDAMSMLAVSIPTKDLIEYALTAVLSTLCIVAGVHYLGKAGAAEPLAQFETPTRVRLRRRIRRGGAWCMIAMSAAFFYLVFELNQRRSPQRVLAAMAIVGLLVFAMLLLATTDVFLTARTRRQFRDRNRE